MNLQRDDPGVQIHSGMRLLQRFQSSTPAPPAAEAEAALYLAPSSAI